MGLNLGGIFKDLGRGLGRTIERAPDTAYKVLKHDTLEGRRGAARDASHAVQEAIGTRSSEGTVSDLPNRILNFFGLGTPASDARGNAPYSAREINAHTRRGLEEPIQTQAQTQTQTASVERRATPAPVEDHSFPSDVSKDEAGLDKLIEEKSKQYSTREIDDRAAAIQKIADKNGVDVVITPLVVDTQPDPYVSAQVNRDALKEKIETHYQAASTGFLGQVQQNMGLDASAPAANDAQYKQVANAPSLIPGH